MTSITEWIASGLTAPLSYNDYLSSRGVTESTSIKFHSWTPPQTPSPCPKFTSTFGALGLRLKEQLLVPIHSPRGVILGFEARQILPDGSKKVTQYRNHYAQWNPYFLGAEKAFKTLWAGGDIWIVEGMFDMVSLERVVPSSDAVISTLRAGMDKVSMEMIERFCSQHSTIHICYDNDETGRNKTEWLYRLFLKSGLRVTKPVYRGKDPNEVWKLGGDTLLKRYFLF